MRGNVISTWAGTRSARGPGLRGGAGPAGPAKCAAAALTGLGLLLIAACSGGGGGTHRAAPVVKPAKVIITMGNLSVTAEPAANRGAGTGISTRSDTGELVDSRPDQGIHVTAVGGTLSSVLVTNQAGKSVAGTLATGGTSWHTSWALAPSHAYSVTATAVNAKGVKTVGTEKFRTLKPRRTFTASVDMGPGEVVGVGMPIMVTFSHVIRNRAAVERSLEIWSGKPVTGAWYWMSSTQVWFRPQKYWPAHNPVRFVAHLDGVQGAPGMYGTSTLKAHFTIGNSLIARASTRTHYMKVWWNGRLKGNWPISTGQPGDDTPNGAYLTINMGNPVDMNSATFGVMPGDPGYYNVLVYDSVRFTWSGDYVHSAPWSVGEQGIVNVSHGCVNVAPGNAAWYYDHSVRGDPVTIVGSPVAGTWGDGWTIYFLSWRKLIAGSATGEAVQADSGGSQFVLPSQVTPGSHQSHVRAVQA